MSVTKKVEFLFREKRCEEVERNPVADEFRSPSIDIFDAYEREVLVPGLRRLDFASYCISCFQCVLLDLELRYIDVVR